MKTVKFFTAFVLMLIIAIGADAQDGRSVIQQRRINQGTRSGEITRHERRQLGRQQRHIRREKMEARADGVVTPAERRHIRRDERRASRNIVRKKHNRRNRI